MLHDLITKWSKYKPKLGNLNTSLLTRKYTFKLMLHLKYVEGIFQKAQLRVNIQCDILLLATFLVYPALTLHMALFPSLLHKICSKYAVVFE